MKKEIWKNIPIHPWDGWYEVSNLGRVRRTPTIVPQYLADGYCRIALRVFGSKASVVVHRLVAAAFIRPPKADECVNHKNCDRSDNRPENLEWVTMLENLDHAKKNLTYLPKGLAKLVPEIVYMKYKEGQTKSQIALDFGMDIQGVCNMIKKYKMDDDRVDIDHIINRKYSTRSKNIDFKIAKDMSKKGIGIAEIAKRFDATSSSVYLLFKKNGFKHKKKDSRSHLDIKKIIKLRKNGMSLENIAEKEKSSFDTVRNILHENGAI